jgi:ABC-type polar amino acid transport system ATPase subunit
MDELLLDIMNVNKFFGHLHILKGVSFQLKKKETAVLIGRSGSGKSTILRCINLLENIQSGRIFFKGRDITEYQLKELREEIGIVFQSYNLFPHLSAVKNVSLALKVVKKIPDQEAHSIAVDTLRKVGLEDKINSYPRQLSGGQQQRVAIARSLAMKPSLMMFDEVTSALDPELIGEVLRVMEEVAKAGMTMLVVTHEMGFARHVAKKVIYLDEGTIIESGTPREIFDHPKDKNLKKFIKAIL